MKGFHSNTLREGIGVRANPAGLAASKPKAEKGFKDPFCHNETRVYARSGEKWLLTTICSGVRYVLEPIEPPEKYPFINKMYKKTTKTLP